MSWIFVYTNFNVSSVLQGLQAWVGSEPTPSESLVTSDDEAVRAKPSTQHTRAGTLSPLKEPCNVTLFSSAVLSASPHSTPPYSRPDETPFVADNPGDTVVRLDKVLNGLEDSTVHLYNSFVRRWRYCGSHICLRGIPVP